MNQFGGDWTEQKIDIVVDYAKAYLTIMNKYPQFETLYFDGFAGSGDIYKGDKIDFEIIKGSAIRVLEIDKPKSFDIYYFVELDEDNKNNLKNTIHEKFPNKKHHVVCDDCNVKLVDMSKFLDFQPNVKVLAFIDPFGMSLKWSSVEVLKGRGIDLWVLVPTGIGMNRLLKRNGDIKDSWLTRLEISLGLDRKTIKEYFYKSKTRNTLFGAETFIEKEKDAIEKAAQLYKNRLQDVFKFVSNALPLKNSTGSIMYHFMMATNNVNAFKIANDVINKRK
jgi:three-Cys-motif partner protein